MAMTKSLIDTTLAGKENSDEQVISLCPVKMTILKKL